MFYKLLLSKQQLLRPRRNSFFIFFFTLSSAWLSNEQNIDTVNCSNFLQSFATNFMCFVVAGSLTILPSVLFLLVGVLRESTSLDSNKQAWSVAVATNVLQVLWFYVRFLRYGFRVLTLHLYTGSCIWDETYLWDLRALNNSTVQDNFKNWQKKNEKKNEFSKWKAKQAKCV